MTPLDIGLIIILFFFVATGFRYGLIITFGTLVGLIAGVYVGGMYFERVGAFLLDIFAGNENLAKVVAFVLIFLLTARIVGLVFWAINKAFKIISVIPFLSSFNRLGGALFGFLEGAIFLGVALMFVDKYPFSDSIIPAVQASEVAQWLLGYGKLFAPLLPDAVRAIESKVNLPFDLPDIPDASPDETDFIGNVEVAPIEIE